jgi:hypothetical protein
MQALIEDGTVARLIVAVLLAEAAFLLVVAWRRRRRRSAPPLRELLPTLASGLFLVLALEAALAQSGWLWIGGWLVAALAAHLVDLRVRWRTSWAG